MVQNIADIVEGNGKTIRENNHNIQHSIPLYTLVEINANVLAESGMRLLVQGHTRDCDGTPLYMLTHDARVVGKNVHENPKSSDPLSTAYYWQTQGKVISGYGESALIIIESAESVLKRIKHCI